MDKVMVRPTKRAGREKWVNRRMADVLVKMGIYEIVDDTPAVQAEPVKTLSRPRRARRVTAKAIEPETSEPVAEPEPEAEPEVETEVEFTPAPALEVEVEPETPKRTYRTRRLKAEE